MAGALAIVAGLVGAGKWLSSYPTTRDDVTHVPLSHQPNSTNMFDSDTVDAARATLQHEADRRFDAAAQPGSRTVNRFINSIGTEAAHQANVALLQSNMVPFTRGDSRQPAFDKPSLRLEQFTQNTTEQAITYRPKQEALSFYDTQQINNVFPGNEPSTRSHTIARTSQIVSRMHQGVPLNEPIQVGPGVTQQYEAAPSGGRHPMFRPTFKGVNELRTQNDHQRITLKGTVVPGQKGSKPGTTGIVPKNRPDTVFAPIAPVPTKVDVQKAAAQTFREPVPLTVRQLNEERPKHRGPSKANVNMEGTRPEYINDDRGVLTVSHETAAHNASGGGTVDATNRFLDDRYASKPSHDYMAGPNLTKKGPVRDPRDKPEWNQRMGYGEDTLRPNMGGSIPHLPVHDPRDVAPLLQRQIDGEVHLYGPAGGASRGHVKDPHDVAPVPQRQIDGEVDLYGPAVGAPRGLVKDPHDVPLTTGREGLPERGPGDTTVTGLPLPQVNAYDGAFVTTRRDQLGDYVPPVQVGRALPAHRTVHDPSDTPNAPRQDGTLDATTRGYAAPGTKGSAFSRDPTNWVFNKATPLVPYTGQARQNRGSGYVAAKWEQKNTQRQKVSDFLFQPASGSGTVHQGSGTRHSAYHMDNERRKEALLQTHAPTPSGDKVALHADGHQLLRTTQEDPVRASQAWKYVRQGVNPQVVRAPHQPDTYRTAQDMPFRLNAVIQNELVQLPGAQFS